MAILEEECWECNGAGEDETGDECWNCCGTGFEIDDGWEWCESCGGSGYFIGYDDSDWMCCDCDGQGVWWK